MEILVQRIGGHGCVIGSLSKRDDAHHKITLMIGCTALPFILGRPNQMMLLLRVDELRSWICVGSTASTLVFDWLRKYFKAIAIGFLISSSIGLLIFFRCRLLFCSNPLFGDSPRNVVFSVCVVGFLVHVVYSVYVIFSAEIYVFPPPGLYSGCDLAPGDTQHLVGIFLF